MFRSRVRPRRWRAVRRLAGGGVACAGAGLAIAALASFGSETLAPLLSWLARDAGPRAMVLNSDDEWMQAVRSGRFWRGGSGSEQPAAPLGASGRPDRFSARPVQRPEPEPTIDAGAYRTMCVRLCDGYAWPISFATSSSSFARDQTTCERSCSSPARLFTHRNPGAGMEDMVDLDGRPYSALPTAFFYQAVYDESCKCRAHPWETESLERHRGYALEARARKGDKQARAELRKKAGDTAPTQATEPRRGKSRRRR